jgi:hypothetical protein
MKLGNDLANLADRSPRLQTVGGVAHRKMRVKPFLRSRDGESALSGLRV